VTTHQQGILSVSQHHHNAVADSLPFVRCEGIQWCVDVKVKGGKASCGILRPPPNHLHPLPAGTHDGPYCTQHRVGVGQPRLRSAGQTDGRCMVVVV
jgi:hypothetical protein